MSEEQVNKYWGHWLLWRASGQRMDYLGALSLPKALLDVLFELDNLYEKMVRKAMKAKTNKDKGLGH